MNAPTQPLAPFLVDVRNVSFAYNGSQPILKDISLGVRDGSITMILGPSGSGKTTLLKLIKGLLKAQQGEVRWGIDPIREMAYIPQGLGLVRSLTVLENVLVGALSRMGTLTSLLKAFPKTEIHKAEEKLHMLGLGGKEAQKAFHISGGERQRVAIARALMQEPRLILADEFISQLDHLRTIEIMELVRGISQGGVTFLITTHDVELVPRYGHWAIFVRDGEKVHECPAHQVNEKSLVELLR